MTIPETFTMHDAWESVVVTREQASAIFDKLGELIGETPELKAAFENASVTVLEPPPPIP